MIFRLCGERQMERFGAALARHLLPGMLITLSGALGAGKTTLARGIIRGLGCADDSAPVVSPTYTLVQSYASRDSLAPVHHFDLYRIENAPELENIGFRDYFDGAAVCLIEWPEHGAGLLPQAQIVITITIEEPCRWLDMQPAEPERWALAFDALQATL